MKFKAVNQKKMKMEEANTLYNTKTDQLSLQFQNKVVNIFIILILKIQLLSIWQSMYLAMQVVNFLIN